MIFAFFGKNPTNTKKYPIGYPDFSVGAKYVQFFQGYLKEWFFTSFLEGSIRQTILKSAS